MYNMNEILKPTIYCDVDGVLNVYSKDNNLKSVIARRRTPSVGLYLPKVPLRFKWYENIANEIVNELAAFVDFKWLTTWNDDAVRIIEPLTGIRSSGFLNYRMRLSEAGSQVKKYAVLKEHQLLNPSPFIWIDDVATKHYREEDWTGHHDHLIIRTNRKLGLTMEHLDSMKDFLKSYKLKTI
jgi:hypothetical protein